MRYPHPAYLLRPQMIPVVARQPALAGLGEMLPQGEDQDLQLNYGIQGFPRILAPDYQALETTIVNIIEDKVKALPWLPDGWATRINQARAAYPEWRFMLKPPLSIFGTRLSTAPAWLDTDEKVQVWQAIAKDMQKAMQLYGEQKGAEGLIILNSRYLNAAFWDTAYTITKAIADAPGMLVEAAGDFASGLTGKFLKSFWPVLLVAGAGAFVYYNRKRLFTAR